MAHKYTYEEWLEKQRAICRRYYAKRIATETPEERRARLDKANEAAKRYNARKRVERRAESQQG